MTSATPSEAVPASADRRKRSTGAVAGRSSADRAAAAITLVMALAVVVVAVMALVSPDTYRDFVGLAGSDAFVRLAGSLLVGVGLTLLLAMFWHDALLVALASFVVGSTLLTVLYAGADDAEGGALALFAALAVAAVISFVTRYRAQGLLVGDVGPGTTNPVLAPYVRQKTVLLTSYKRDGTPVGTPVSIMVDGDHAYIRSFEKAFKTYRIRNNPEVEIAPCTGKGKPTGTGFRAHAQRLDGPENERAFHMIGRKQPFMQGFLVPFGHKAANKKTGNTIQFKITPL